MAKLQKTIWSNGFSLPLRRGWWAVVGNKAFFLWDDERGPVFDDLDRLIREMSQAGASMEEIIEIARADEKVVRRRTWPMP